MNTFLDIFRGDAFSNVTLTTKVNQVQPYVPGLLTDMNLTGGPQGMTTLDAAFEDRKGGNRMISSTPRGAPPSELAHFKGTIKKLTAFHFAREITVNADELLGARSNLAGTNPITLQSLLLERTDGPSGVKMDWAMTWEHMLLGLVQGKVYDADGITPMWDYYDWTGTTKPDPQNLVITGQGANTSNFVDFALTLKSTMIDEMQGFGVPGSAQIVVLCGKNFFRALMTSGEVREARKAGAFGSTDAATILSGSTPYSVLNYADIQWIGYRGTVDSMIAVPDDSAVAFMRGVPGLFEEFYAPADTFETVTDAGVPYYLLNDPNKKNSDKRAVFELQSNPLLVNRRPRSCIPITKS